MIQIALTCCLVAAALAAPQGRYLPPQGGYSNRNSIVQASALPRRFSVSKPSANKYQGASSGQYQGSSSTQYQGATSGQYSSAAQPQYSADRPQYGVQGGGNQYRGAAQYTTEDPYSEPANYDFSYEVNAPEYNVQFGHQESRQDMFAKGMYQVLLPDGRTQVVEYEADQEGYRPTITYQEAKGGYGGGNGGYAQNGNGYSPKGGSAGKASYGAKNSGYSGSQNYGGSGGYQQVQGYKY